MKYLNFRSSGSKLESFTWNLTKNLTLSQLFFKQSLLLVQNSNIKKCIFIAASEDKFSWMAASQRQLQRYIYLTNSKLRIPDISYCDVWLKRKEFFMDLF